MNLLVSGWYGHGNTGDELLLDLFLERNREHSVTVLTQGNISPERASHVYHADIVRFDAGGLRQWLDGRSLRVLRALLRTDCVVLGGGGILRESGNFDNLRRLLDEIHIGRELGKMLFVYGVSIGPIASSRGRRMIASALSKCDHVTVRDRFSRDHLRDFGIADERCTFAPDPVFTLAENDVLVEPLDAELSRRVANGEIPLFLATGLADSVRNPGASERLAAALDLLALRDGSAFVAVPFQRLASSKRDDHDCALELKSLMRVPERLYCYPAALSAGQLIGLMDAAPLVICARLHAMILAITRETPFVAISYDEKVDGTADVAGVTGSVVSPNESFVEEFVRVVEDTVHAAPARVEARRTTARTMADAAERTFKEFRSLLLAGSR